MESLKAGACAAYIWGRVNIRKGPGKTWLQGGLRSIPWADYVIILKIDRNACQTSTNAEYLDWAVNIYQAELCFN